MDHLIEVYTSMRLKMSGTRKTLSKFCVVVIPVKGILCRGVGLCGILEYFHRLMDDQRVDKGSMVLGSSQFFS